MIRSLSVVAVAGVTAVALTGCGSAEPAPAQSNGIGGTVTVFAAASLTETFTELGKRFEAAHPGVRVVYSFAASSALAEQIVQGAPADVFASAAPKNMQQLVDKGEVSAEPVTFVRNRLEIAVPKGNPAGITGLADFGKTEPKIALCAEQVPCGAAAKTVFQVAGVDPRPDTREADVKAVLTKVKLGEVDAALVYRTDVRAGGAQVQGITFPEADKAVNDYPVAPLAHAPNTAAAAAFVEFVRSEQARAVFTEAGFDLP
ncbi:molybdate ABC transporter substrate-binding protein [Nocardia abscessus]|uniref:molybdate ABC transporter substrate-binding protein n=1 Tax=Nocardia abscessus TaxID=120957 RepID=UPI0024548E87|nr:molybdate ABC transporter substrate-binding protein [Nocardia abscessus]